MNDDPAHSANSDIHATATAWWVKADAGPLSRQDQAAFAAWMAEDPAHRAAFDLVSALCGELRGLRSASTLVAATPRPPRRSQLAPAAALLVGSLAAILVIGYLSIRLRTDFRTSTGETRLVVLEDGSQVQIGARSALAVNDKGSERRLTLIEGEAWFHPAPNASRPFVVEAAGGTVTALGTSFDVALEESGAEVAVSEHRVAVSSGGQSVIVEEGRRSGFSWGAPATLPAPIDVDSIAAWRRGKLAFVDKPLGEVVATLGRYHNGYVFIPDPAVRRLRVTGIFDSGRPLDALRAIEASLGLHATYFTNYLVVLLE
ncbi:FecR family protein [Methylocapsa acidiphila]|uniref:FecR family protein n=1 Tax=Methylocapsa acidiphila TaxID=133552 RepID=UPI00041F1B7F|nr:FecR family protein [Methylocapsa acidiphila]